MKECEHVGFIEDVWWCPRCMLFRLCVGGLLILLTSIELGVRGKR